tara:strand:+ start:3063 stop:3449 length:387 start_codon:yes stop_codon:yes gene_type:complete
MSIRSELINALTRAVEYMTQHEDDEHASMPDHESDGCDLCYARSVLHLVSTVNTSMATKSITPIRVERSKECYHCEVIEPYGGIVEFDIPTDENGLEYTELYIAIFARLLGTGVVIHKNVSIAYTVEV